MQFHLGYVTETIWNHNFYLPLVCYLTSDLKVFTVYTRRSISHFHKNWKSVLGPLFFVLYTNYISNIIRQHGIKYHVYVDDIQLHISFDLKDENASNMTLAKLSACINDIHLRMSRNMLKLNNSKTEFFVAASSHNLNKLQDVSLKIGDITISPSSTIKNLGVIFDQKMSMENHVKSLIKTANFHLRNIYRIRRFITFESCHHLVRSLVLSRLDYANSLLFGISAKDRKKLETLQNKAARIIFRCNRLEPSAPLLRELHWLPVKERVIYKVLLLTYKSVNKLAPAYLTELLKAYKPGYENLRSAKKCLLDGPGTHRKWQCFLCCCPQPLELTSSSHSAFSVCPHF